MRKANAKDPAMTRTSERDRRFETTPIPRDEALDQLYGVYERALDEYSEATSVVYDRIRHRTLPTTEEFARKRVAQLALVNARRAYWKATRRSQRTH
jgi:hypothetical protein